MNEGQLLAQISGEEYIPTGTENKFIKADIAWGYCDLCDTAYLKCPKCGNNSCNGGNGRIWVDVNIGIPCDLCDAMWKVETFLRSEFLVPERQEFIDLTTTETVVN